MRFEMLDQCHSPGVARRRVAERVELERYAVVNAELAQKLVAERQNFHVRSGFARANDFGIQLVELPEPPLLRTLIAKSRAVGRKLQRRELLPALAEVGAADAGRELRSKRDQFTAAILERIHFLRDHIGGLANGPGEDRGRLDDRYFDTLEPEQATHPIEGVDHRVEAVGLFSEQGLGPANGLRRRHLRGLRR